MLKRTIIKNHLQEIRLIRDRCLVVLVIMSTLIVLLIGRLGFLQVMRHHFYSTLSQKNWLDLIPIEPARGLIYDRHGYVLADNVAVFSLDMIREQANNIPQTIRALQSIIPLSEIELLQFQRKLKMSHRFDDIPLKIRLSETEVARFYENQYRFPGFRITPRLMRHYPFNQTFSHVLGYEGRITLDELKTTDPANYSASNYMGKTGIEQFYETDLHGTVGYLQAESNANGQVVRVLKEIKPHPGKNITLTLDSQLQQVAEKAFAGLQGAAVAIQPNTGQILAMVSEPTYDPNAFVLGISNRDYHALQSATEHPLYDRALHGLYPMASTVKPYIALEWLDNKDVDPNFSIADHGWFQLPNSEHRFHDWKPGGHGTVHLHEAIMSSCDTYFFTIAHRTGMEPINHVLNEFGYSQPTGIDLKNEPKGIVASPEWKRRVKKLKWYEGDTLISTIGQGYMQATPLQLAQAVATLAMRGTQFTPHLLLKEEEKDKPPIFYSTTPKKIIQLNHNESWQFVINAMQDVIASPHGTGYLHFGHDAPYSIAAKTGTAQIHTITHRDKNGKSQEEGAPQYLRDHTLFVAFAPVDHPQIAIAVIAENSKQAGHIARLILDYYLTPKASA